MIASGRLLGLLAALCFGASCCGHSVVVYSVPDGAEIYVNGRAIGRAPVTFEEKSGYHKEYSISAELAGYEPWTEEHTQDQPSRLLVPSLVGAYVLLLPVVGVLWGYQLPDQVTLTLEPIK